MFVLRKSGHLETSDQALYECQLVVMVSESFWPKVVTYIMAEI